MKRVALALFLCAIIGSTFVYSALYVSFNLANPDNPVNRVYRLRFIADPQLRTFLKLRQLGDARFDFATPKHFTRLVIVPYVQDGQALDPETLPLVTSEIKRVIDKPQGIAIGNPVSLPDIPPAVSDEDLSRIIRTYATDFVPADKIAYLHLFILKQYKNAPTYTGLVEDDRSIFLFMDSIREVSDKQPTTRYAEVSTILHEFAHLLGANHIDNDECIMAEKVENTTYFNFASNIVESYCQVDIDEIRRALQNKST